jgi:hypothetical protein
MIKAMESCVFNKDGRANGQRMVYNNASAAKSAAK